MGSFKKGAIGNAQSDMPIYSCLSIYYCNLNCATILHYSLNFFFSKLAANLAVSNLRVPFPVALGRMKSALAVLATI